GGRRGPDEVRGWDAADGRLLRSFPAGEPHSDFAPHALSPDGTLLAAGGGDFGDPALPLRDTASGEGAARLRGHAGGGTAALASPPDGKTLASGGRDTTVLLWDVARARLGHLWAELGGGQGGGARAGKGPAATPEEAVPFLKDRLRRAAA